MSDDRRLTEPQVAAWFGAAPDTVRRWRRKGVGPRHRKAAFGSRRITYAVADVRRWAEEHGVELTSAEPPPNRLTPRQAIERELGPIRRLSRNPTPAVVALMAAIEDSTEGPTT